MSTAAQQNPSLSANDEPMVVWSISASQKKFLTQRLPDYKTAFLNNALMEFWGVFYNEWFDTYPIPMDDDESRIFIEEQLRAWLLSNSKWVPNASQRLFLKEHIAGYKHAQENKTLVDFWPRLFSEWFSRWAPTDVAPMGLVEKKLKSWFNNNARVSANGREVLTLSKPSKRTRRLTESQTFCKVYWNRAVEDDGTTLSQVVNRDWVIGWKNDKKYDPKIRRPNPPVHFINAIASAVYDDQNEDVHEEISQHPIRMKPEVIEEEEEEVSEDIIRARKYAKAIATIPYTLDLAGKQILQKTGFVSLMMVAGPDPSRAGNIVVYSFTEGTTSSNCNFLQYCPALDRDMLTKFADFARLAFPASERVKRTLPGTEHLRNYEVPIESPLAAATTPSAPPAGLLPAMQHAPADAELHQITRDDHDDDMDEDMAATPFPSPPPTVAVPVAAVPEADNDTTIVAAVPIIPVTAAPEADNDTTLPGDASLPDEDMDATDVTTVPPVAAPAAADSSPVVDTAAVSSSAPQWLRDAGAPQWLQDAIEQLTSLSAEPRWKVAMTRFIDFEKSLGFLNGRIATNMLAPGRHRPKEVAVWVKGARQVGPPIKNVTTFGSQWKQWYYELQPDCRKVTDDEKLQRVAPVTGEWPELRKGTINGVYGILASLGWWIKAAHDGGVPIDDAMLALDDFIWVLESMAQSGLPKHASSESSGRASKRTRVD